MYPNQYPNPQKPGFPAQPVYAVPTAPPGVAPVYPSGYHPAAGQVPGYSGYPQSHQGYPGQVIPPQMQVPMGFSAAPSYPGMIPQMQGYPGAPAGQPVQLAPVDAPKLSESLTGYKEKPTIKEIKSDPRSDALVLRKAMKGIGTDETAITNVLTKRTNKQCLEIAKTFKADHGKDLIKNLKSELSGHVEKLTVALVTPRCQYLAGRLHKAIAGLGTREIVLLDILCTSSNAEIKAISDAYKQLFKKTLENDISGDTSGHFCKFLVCLCQAKRDEKAVVNKDASKNDAQALYKAGEKRIGTDESTFIRIFTSSSFPQIRSIMKDYEVVSCGTSLKKAVKKEFSGNLKTGLITILEVAENKAVYFAKRLHESVAGAGTNDGDLIYICVTRAEIDMENIKQEYVKKQNNTMAQAISGDTSGDYKKMLLGLVGH
ncbi:Annexin A7 [Orchesella cincta]|uniref:Annexin A7 n=1 Tax=Orchesella cincta TaxID=48709 RepID=A0A1D2M656_ORCCI|nr:Annexin A7 [Orchesella cincta]